VGCGGGLPRTRGPWRFYGGAGFVSALIHEGLIDEFHIFVNQMAIGAGLRIFPERVKLKLVKATPLSIGTVILFYVKG